MTYGCYSIKRFVLSALVLAPILAGCGDPEVRKQEAYEKAKALYDQGEIRSAVLELRNAIQIDPEFTEARYHLGLCFLRQQNHAAAVSEFRRVEEAGPQAKQPELDRYLAEALVGAGEYDEGRALCEGLLKENPDDAAVRGYLSEALIGLSDQAFRSAEDGDSRQAAKDLLEQAREEAKKAVEQDDGLVAPHMTLARALISARRNALPPAPLSDVDAAAVRDHFESVKKSRPGSNLLRHRMVRLWRWAGNRAEALRDVDSILASSPDDAEAQLAKAELLFEDGDVDKATALAQGLVDREARSPRLNLLIGRSLLVKEEFEQAREEFRKAKDTPSGAYLFGLCLYKLGDRQHARDQFEQVLSKVPEHEDARRALFDMHMRDGNRDRAALEADEAVRVAPFSPFGHLLQARAYAAEEDWKKAREAVDSALALAPDMVDALVQSANIHRRTGALSESAAEIDKLVKLHPEEPIGYLVRSQQGLEQKQFEAAESDARRAGELSPENPRPRVMMARARIGKGDLDGAVAAYEDALKIAADDASVRLALAGLRAARKEFKEGIEILEAVPLKDRLYAQARRRIAEMYDAMGDTDAAAAEFEKLLASDPEAADATVGMFKHLWRAEEFAEIEQLAKSTLERDPTNPLGHLMLSDLYAGQRLWPQAAEEMKAAVDIQPDSARLLYRLGSLYANLGRFEDALDAFQRAREQQPDFDAAALGAAKTLAALGKADEGEEICAQVIQRKPSDPNALLAMAEIKAVQEQTAEAESLYNKATEASPRFLLPYLRLAALREKDGRGDEAKEAYQKALEAAPDVPELFVEYGRFHERQGDKEAARQQYLHALELAPDNPRLQDIVARGALDAGDYADAEKRLRGRIEKTPEDLGARLNLALVLDKQGRTREATQSLVDFISASDDPDSTGMGLSHVLARNRGYDEVERLAESLLQADADSWVAHYALGMAKAGQGDLEAAREQFAQAAELNAETPILKHAEGTVRAQMKQYDEALKAYESALAIDGKFIPAYMDAARVCLRQESLDRAETLCVQAAEADPENPGPRLLLALVDVRRGRAAEAMKTVSELLDRSPQHAVRASTIVDALRFEGNYRDAIALTEECLTHAPDNPILVMKLGTLHQGNGDLESAAREYERLTRLAPKAAASYNNLACILVRQERIDEALPHARKAHELAPNHPGIQDTLGWALFKKGDAEEAIPLLESAAKGMPKEPEVLYHLAKAYAHKERKDDARELFNKALALSTDFSGSDDARKMLNDVGSGAGE